MSRNCGSKVPGYDVHCNGCIQQVACQFDRPHGEGNAQSRASAKWQKKKGLTVKGFKISVDVAEAFAEACEEKGVGQSAQIEKYMRGFIKRCGVEIG